MSATTEAIYVLQALATLLVAIVGWFIKRTLDRLDKHLDDVERRQEEHNARIAQIEGWQRAVAPAWARRDHGESSPR